MERDLSVAKLLAKQPRDRENPEPCTMLSHHLNDVSSSFIHLFGTLSTPTRLARQWFNFFRLELNIEYSTFHKTCLAACALHDIGKANSGFQEAVRGARDAQVIRHEHLSGLILWLPEIRQWLERTCSLDSRLLVSAIIGHHLKADRTTFPMRLLADRDQFLVYPKAILDILVSLSVLLNVTPPELPEIHSGWSFSGRGGTFSVTGLGESLKRDLHRFSKQVRENPVYCALLCSIREALVVSDSAGSGLVRQREDIRAWLDATFDEMQLLNDSSVEERVISPRIAEIKKKRGNFRWSDFQDKAETLPARTLLLAPCGSGKTLAAWRWIKGRARQHPVSRIIFLYPTRGTATEGFRDYVSWAPEADAALVHGTASYELDGMFDNPSDHRYDRDFTVDDRLFALAYWQRRIFSATVDQFLGFMQHSYRSMCLLPLVVDSLIVIDEVHSFDKPLFSALKLFLKTFSVPVLCMTASLPRQRCRELQECGLTIFPDNEVKLEDLEASAQMPRYRVHGIETSTEAQTIAKKGLAEGKRVLWVVNTVTRCQELAIRQKALCYHSRFRLKDRKQRHGEVVAAFQQQDAPAFAITTQVCEMSLDLDCDVLISEVAPITSMIQRMGRCNRHAQAGAGRIGDVFFYPPGNERPYEPVEIERSRGFLHEMNGAVISQHRLQELLEKYDPGEVEVERYAAFIKSGPWAVAREQSLREEDDYSVQAIVRDDIDIYLSLRLQGKPIDGLLVPVPRRFAEADSRVGVWPLVAEPSHYSEQFGFLDHPMEDHA